jgi:tetratricopeptide (TPR) repeat protein
VLSYGVAMGLPETGPSSSDVQKVQECYAFWRQGLEGKRLVIVDDVTTVEDYEVVRPFLPTEASFRVLLTTRERLQMERVDLGVLELEESLELLTRLIKAERMAAESELAVELCGWLGNLPLALELVGRYLLSKPRTTVATLLERLKEKKLVAKALLRGQPMTATHGSLAAAFEVSWVTLDGEAQALGAVLSLFGLAGIPQVAVGACLVEWEEEDLEDAWDRLVSLHLVGADEQLHPMLREFLTVKLEERADGEELRERYVAVMLEAAQERCQQTMTREQVREAGLWVSHWIDLMERQVVETFGVQMGMVATHLSLYYYAQGIFKSGEEWSERDLAISEKQLGPDHPDTGTSLNNLATLYKSMGRYEDAEPLYLRALAIKEKQLGPDHPSTGNSLNNLAALYKSMGRYEAAEPLYLRDLAIREHQLGPDHPDTGTSLNNLALLYYSTNRYSEAEPLFLRVYSIFLNCLGEDHPNTRTVIDNLEFFIQQVHQSGQADQLSDHPFTQSILQQIQAAD